MYLRISLLLLFLLSAVSFSYGQSKSHLIGKWTVLEVDFPSQSSLPQKANLEQLEALKISLQKAVFVFNENGTCSLNIPFPPFQFENAQWSYLPDKKLIMIQEKGTRQGSLMSIHILHHKSEESIFQLEDAPIKLKVKKT